MNTEQQIAALCSIIELCAAAMCLVHDETLMPFEDHPAMRGIKGVIHGIEFQAEALCQAINAGQ